MLPAENRIRKAHEFASVFREGKRSGNRILVVHAVVPKAQTNNGEADLSKVGFVVGKKVGNSVVRHRVVRRLRHLVRAELPGLKCANVVVRALPGAADATFEQLGSSLQREFKRLDLYQSPIAHPLVDNVAEGVAVSECAQ